MKIRTACITHRKHMRCRQKAMIIIYQLCVAGVIMEIFAIENHPNDSRVKLDITGTVQSLTSRMGTGGGQHADGIDGIGEQ